MAKNLVITTTKSAAEQTKAQKAFYTHLKKIDKLKAALETVEEVNVYFAQQKGEKLITTEQSLAALRAEWVKCLFRWRNSGSLPRDITQFITQKIVEETYELIDVFEYKELIPIYDECSATTFETERAEAEQQQKNQMREAFAEMGVEIDGDITEENLFEHIANAQEKMKAQQEEAEARKANRKKSAKQQKAADEKAAQQAVQTKSIREIYTQLAKSFHPDTEPDETERVRKTEIMQRITAAYDSNDLPELLRLQLEYEQINLDNLADLADEKLLAYNNVLKAQIRQLDEERYAKMGQLKMQNPQLPPYIFFETKNDVDAYIKREINSMKNDQKAIETDMVKLSASAAEAKIHFKRLKKQDETELKFDPTEMFNILFGR